MAKTSPIEFEGHLRATVSVELTDNVGTMENRIKALDKAKDLLAGANVGDGGIAGALLGNRAPNKGGDQYPEPMPMMRLATFIVTGHDYLDTHPKVDALVIDGGLSETQVRKIVKKQMKKEQGA